MVQLDSGEARSRIIAVTSAGAAEAAERVLREDLLHALVLGSPGMDLEIVRLHQRDRHAVGADAVAGQLARERLREAHRRGARGRGDEEPGLAHAPRVAHQVDDGAGAARGHPARHRMGDAQRARHRHIDLRRPVGGARLEEGLPLGRRGIVDEHVDRAQLVLDARDGAADRAVLAKVRTHRRRLHAQRARLDGRRLGSGRRRMVVKRHMRALAGEGESDRSAEPLSRSGDQHHLAAQLEIHRSASARSAAGILFSIR